MVQEGNSTAAVGLARRQRDSGFAPWYVLAWLFVDRREGACYCCRTRRLPPANSHARREGSSTMQSEQFDELTKALAKGSRRHALKALAASILGAATVGVLGAQHVEAGPSFLCCTYLCPDHPGRLIRHCAGPVLLDDVKCPPPPPGCAHVGTGSAGSCRACSVAGLRP